MHGKLEIPVSLVSLNLRTHFYSLHENLFNLLFIIFIGLFTKNIILNISSF